MANRLKFIKTFDLFPYNVSLFYKNKNGKKSIFGGIFTLIGILFIIVILTYITE